MSWWPNPMALPEPERQPEIIYVDRVVTGEEYVIKLWRHAVETADWYRGQRGLALDCWKSASIWDGIASDIYTVMSRPWFEDKQ